MPTHSVHSETCLLCRLNHTQRQDSSANDVEDNYNYSSSGMFFYYSLLAASLCSLSAGQQGLIVTDLALITSFISQLGLLNYGISQLVITVDPPLGKNYCYNIII